MEKKKKKKKKKRNDNWRQNNNFRVKGTMVAVAQAKSTHRILAVGAFLFVTNSDYGPPQKEKKQHKPPHTPNSGLIIYHKEHNCTEK